MSDDKTPEITKDLVVWLDTMIPERTPGLLEDLRKIDYEIGRRSVVRWLLSVYEDQHREDRGE
jgi:hypothetical protein